VQQCPQKRKNYLITSSNRRARYVKKKTPGSLLWLSRSCCASHVESDLPPVEMAHEFGIEDRLSELDVCISAG